MGAGVRFDTGSSSAISGSIVSFTFTAHNHAGQKFFRVKLPWTVDYGIRYLTGTETPYNITDLAAAL